MPRIVTNQELAKLKKKELKKIVQEEPKEKPIEEIEEKPKKRKRYTDFEISQIIGSGQDY